MLFSHPATLPPAKLQCQDELCWGEIDIRALPTENPDMKPSSTELEPKLYIGEWIEALDLQPRAVAKAAGISEPYLNQLIHRTKDNPSLKVLFKIANAMGMGVRDLQSPPPPRAVLEEIKKIPSAQFERLRRRQATH
jgi:transcriptional regulator with XRE-family HTH domain